MDVIFFIIRNPNENVKKKHLSLMICMKKIGKNFNLLNFVEQEKIYLMS